MDRSTERQPPATDKASTNSGPHEWEMAAQMAEQIAEHQLCARPASARCPVNPAGYPATESAPQKRRLPGRKRSIVTLISSAARNPARTAFGTPVTEYVAILMAKTRVSTGRGGSHHEQHDQASLMQSARQQVLKRS